MLKELIVLSLGLAFMFAMIGCESAPSAPALAAPAVAAAPAAPKPAPVRSVGVGPYSKPGFVTFLDKNVLLVFRAESRDLAKYRKNGDMNTGVIRPAAGPDGLSLKAPDADTLRDFEMTNPDFIFRHLDGRLWVFRNGSAGFSRYCANGELAVHVTRIAAGPGGMTLKAPDLETLDIYMASLKK